MPEQPKRSWWSRNWKWAGPLGCLTPVLACGGFFTFIVVIVFGIIKSSPPYIDSLAEVRANPQAQQALGDPIEPSLIVSGNFETSGNSGSADIAYEVTGPKGSGTVYVVAEQAIGQWTFTTLVLEVEGSSERIDLLPQP